MFTARPSTSPRRAAVLGFTLVELMGVVALLALVVGIFYSCWTALLHSSRSGSASAARVQRERVALKLVGDALGSALMVQSGEDWHQFEARLEQGFSRLSFVSGRPEGGASARGMRFVRVSLAVEPGEGGEGLQLVHSESAAVVHSGAPATNRTVVARGVRTFQVQFPGGGQSWITHWPQPETLPERARIAITLDEPAASDPEGRVREVILGASAFAHAVIEEAQSTVTVDAFKQGGFPVNKGRIVFLIDKSGSMAAKDVSPDRLSAAKQALMATLEKLPPEDEFFIYFFARDFEGMPALSALPATPENILAMRNWVESQEPRSGTDPAGALQAAFELQPTAIWLMSDGGFSRAVLGLADELNPSRSVQINTAAFGSTHFSAHRNLKQLSSQHGGMFLLVAPGAAPK